MSPIAAPRCTVAAAVGCCCCGGTGEGCGAALCGAARGDCDRLEPPPGVAAGEAMLPLPLDSLGSSCGCCLGWMRRGAPVVRVVGLADTTWTTLGREGGACWGAAGRGATVAVALVVGVAEEAEGSDWLRAGVVVGPPTEEVEDEEEEDQAEEEVAVEEAGAGRGDAECGRPVAAGEERVECGVAPGSPLLAAEQGGGTVELTSSWWGEGAAETRSELAEARAATGLSAAALEQP